MKILTLAFLLTDADICLAYKKRGFGHGKWNGYGGKVEAGESVREAAVRELAEESGVRVTESDLDPVALLDFHFVDGTHFRVRAFFVRRWQGDPVETEEMRPGWYDFGDIPYDVMWADDVHWLPRALEGEKLHGTVFFNPDGETINSMTWNTLSDLDF